MGKFFSYFNYGNLYIGIIIRKKRKNQDFIKKKAQTKYFERAFFLIIQSFYIVTPIRMPDLLYKIFISTNTSIDAIIGTGFAPPSAPI